MYLSVRVGLKGEVWLLNVITLLFLPELEKELASPDYEKY